MLRWFGKAEGSARRAYRRYVKEGIEEGRRPDLVGGGLIRSMGGWSEVISMRKIGHKELSDERILGRGKFVDKVINEADREVSCFLIFISDIAGAERIEDRLV